jgi:uncharacterized delta-60 repeat protein
MSSRCLDSFDPKANYQVVLADLDRPMSETTLGNLVSARSLPRVRPRHHDTQKRQLVTLLLALTLVAARAAVVAANPGDLDPSFGTGGTVTTAIGTKSGAFGVAVQGDGKLVAAGPTGDPFPNAFALVRYNPDGSLDATFGSGGTVTTAFGTLLSFAKAVALQGDGKIVVAGDIETLDTQLPVVVPKPVAFALARYNPDGSLDATFGSGGTVTTAIGISGSAWAVALQGDGKIVVPGDTQTTALGDEVFALARYNPDGSLDATFGAGGTVTTAFGTISDQFNAVAVQGDGKIVAAGVSQTAAGPDSFVLARYNPDGSLDKTFGSGGTAIGTTTNGDYANAVALQGDGKIVAVGYTETTYHDPVAFALARYNPDGSLDATFGAGGTVTTAIGTIADAGHAVALQGDGKIVVAGGTRTVTGDAFALARYLGDTTATTSTTTRNTTTTSITTPTGATTTTTTTLPCTTARCTLDSALMSPTCAGQPIPAGVTGKLNKAESLIDQATTSPAKKARRLRQRAKNLLRRAGATATHAAKGKGKKVKLSGVCAGALNAAAAGVAAGL